MYTTRPKHLSNAPTLALLLVIVLSLVGCASVVPPQATAPPAAPTAPPTSPPTAPERTALAAALAVEQQWLSSWFKGTPVRVTQRNDGTLVVDVPREFCFDPGRSNVKPPLAAVLDKVAESLRRRPSAHLELLAAPVDQTGGAALALQRAGQVRRHLRDRGVPAGRLGEPTATSAAAVQLRIGSAPS